MKDWLKVLFGFSLALAGAAIGAFLPVPWCVFALPAGLGGLLLMYSVCR